MAVGRRKFGKAKGRMGKKKGKLLVRVTPSALRKALVRASETKWTDAEFEGGAIPKNGSDSTASCNLYDNVRERYCLNGSQLGSSVDTQRVGDAVEMIRFECRGELRHETPDGIPDGSSPPKVRLILYVDRDNQQEDHGNQPLLLTTSDQNAFRSLQDPRYKARFRILYDKVYELDQHLYQPTGGGTMYQTVCKQFKIGVRIPKDCQHVAFTGTGNDVSGVGIVKNGLYLMAISERTPEYSNTLAAYGFARTWYKDV